MRSAVAGRPKDSLVSVISTSYRDVSLRTLSVHSTCPIAVTMQITGILMMFARLSIPMDLRVRSIHSQEMFSCLLGITLIKSQKCPGPTMMSLPLVTTLSSHVTLFLHVRSHAMDQMTQSLPRAPKCVHAQLSGTFMEVSSRSCS